MDVKDIQSGINDLIAALTTVNSILDDADKPKADITPRYRCDDLLDTNRVFVFKDATELWMMDANYVKVHDGECTKCHNGLVRLPQDTSCTRYKVCSCMTYTPLYVPVCKPVVCIVMQDNKKIYVTDDGMHYTNVQDTFDPSTATIYSIYSNKYSCMEACKHVNK